MQNIAILQYIAIMHFSVRPFPVQVKLTMHSMKSLTCVGGDVWIQLMEWSIRDFAPFLLNFYPGHSLGLVLVSIRSTVEAIMVIIAQFGILHFTFIFIRTPITRGVQ